MAVATAANCTGPTCECFEAGIFQPDETPPPPSLVITAIVHLYLVFILGTIFNGVAIWCVATCKKTRPSVKVLLYSVFVPLLVICVVTRPMQAEIILTLLHCDTGRTNHTFRSVTWITYSSLAQMELACITTLAIVRLQAVWSHRRHAISLPVASTIVITIFIHSFLSCLGFLGSMYLGLVQEHHIKRILITIYFSINVMLPFLITTIAYALMLYAMRQNKQRLAVYKSTSTSTTLDQATRAMIAVFISNLVFGLPHAINHIHPSFTYMRDIIFHILFYTHFVVDPLVFVWYNSGYRRQVFEVACKAWKSVIGRCKCKSPNESLRKISSALPLWKSSSEDRGNESSNSSSDDPKDVQMYGAVLGSNI